MNVLWIVNTLPPNIAECFGIKSKHAISWVDAMGKRLECSPDVSLGIATLGNDNNLHHKLIGRIDYYILPKSDSACVCYDAVLKEFKPDIIHCYGTEERIPDLCNRVKEFLDELKSKEYKSVLIVAHSGVSKAFYIYFNGVPEDGKMLNLGLKNTEVKEYYL